MMEWISVKDRLPEESGNYIVAAFTGADIRTSMVPYSHRIKHWNLTGARSYWKILYWMPLPEPPKGEADRRKP